MGQFYIHPTNDFTLFFELSATTDISLTQESSITNYPIEDGSQVSDNVVLAPRTASLKGVLTSVSQSGFRPIRVDSRWSSGSQHVQDFVIELQSRIDDKTLFDVTTTDNLNDLKRCIITNFTLNKDNTLGGNSWKVSLDLQQVRTADRAQVGVVIDVDFANLLTAKKKANQSTADGSGNQKDKTFVNLSNSYSDEEIQELERRANEK